MSKPRRGQAFIFLAGMLITSCVPVNQMVYVQSPPGTPAQQMIFVAEPVDTQIKPGDQIYIRISSADEAPTMFSAEMMRGIYDASLLSYTVNEDGTIKLPYIGKIRVMNQTLEQASEAIEEAMSQYLFMPNVYMRFINTKVTLLGEVNRPGVYVFNEKNINILQALGYASDVAEFGNRQNVLLIREEGNRRSKHYIDLTRADLLESPFYVLQSDDILYVEPLGRKRWGMTTVPYNLVLTVISTGLFVYTVIRN